MEAKAVARWVRTGPRKVRKFADLIRGRKYADARAVLSVQGSPAAAVLGKCLASAGANAENNHDMDPEDLIVKAAMIDESFRIPRMKHRARGRADRMSKRTCHITIVVSDEL